MVKLLLGKAPAGVYNVAGEDTRPLRDYIEELHRLCGSLEAMSSRQAAQCGGHGIADAGIDEIKGSIGFTQQIF